ncbi:GIY-YIG nuclease family protein [Chloroflexota bacterium]
MRSRKKPSTFNRILKSLADLSEKEKKTPGTLSNAIKSLAGLSGSNGKQGKGVKKCRYWNCNRNIRADHFLCPEHYEDWEDYVIDKCPECGRYKDVGYDVCKDCYSSLNKKYVGEKSNSQTRIEHSKAWEKGDKGVEKFFVYILKDDKGSFYVGQTRDLRIRLGEHRDGKTKTTSGRNLKLQYFEELSNRKSAELKEVELKQLLNSNERTIRKMIQDFQDRVREVQIG